MKKRPLKSQLSHLCQLGWVLHDCVKKCHIVSHLVNYLSVTILRHPGQLKVGALHLNET